jgi:uncharacterized protein (TIGR00251 family)
LAAHRLDGTPPWQLRGADLVLTVRLTPKSARDDITGIESLSDGRAVLKARVRALPQEGEANAALIRLIAKALALPRTAVELESGATSRIKTLILKGDALALQAQLAAIVKLA